MTPRAMSRAKRTIMFIVKPRLGMNIKAKNEETGTERPTNMALVVPIKNMRTRVTNTKPMMMELVKSLTVVRVTRL